MMSTSIRSLMLHSLVLLIILFILELSMIEAYCGSREFTCQGDSVCIPQIWKCDDHEDCADGSDEFDCAPKSCDLTTEFKCTNGTGCVPKRWECDGELDCIDGSDEDPVKCGGRTCPSDEFSCGPGQPCVPQTWQCDSHNDCPNGEDEDNCPEKSCVAEEFQCNNGQCITMRWRCDNDNDCGDGSDEDDCAPPTCPPGEFLCHGNSSRCIPELWKCDGDRDCVDNSDEQNCEDTPIPESHCSSTEFMCGNYECVHMSWKCDGEPDCTDNSDEFDCQTTCSADQFVCANGHECIPGNQECDGFPDCADSSDEPEGCGTVPQQCLEGQFDCTMDGKNCIDMALTCNGNNDCGQREDERNDICHSPNPCNTDNGGCDHRCVYDRHRYYCECNAGYKLDYNNKTCIDINECEIPGMCSQFCTNTIGSFQCRCTEGYVRDPVDHRRCKVFQEEPHLLFSNRYDMRQMGLHTGTYRPVLDRLKAAIGLDFDYSEKKIYYTDVALEQIMVANLVEESVNNSTTVLVRNSVNTPDGLALDWIHKNLYWTDTGMDTIEVMCLKTKHRKTLFNTELDEPRAIVVDPRETQGWIYWTDWGNHPKIERAGMDGTNRRTIISGNDIKWPNGLTIDYTINRLFWVDAKLHLIGSSDLQGHNREVIHTSQTYLKHPFAISVFEDWLYWSDWETESISSVRKFKNTTHTNQVSNVVLGLQSPMDVRVYHPFKQPDATSRCLNHGCSHMCLPTPRHSANSAMMSCHCPNGMMLSSDKRTCEMVTTPPPPTKQTTTPRISKPGDTTSSTDEHDHDKITKHADESDQDVGKIAGIVVGIIGALVIITAVIGYFVYKSLMHRNIKSLNFDNPVYRKTTEDTFSLEKHQYQPSKTLPPTLEPLTQGVYEYV